MYEPSVPEPSIPEDFVNEEKMFREPPKKSKPETIKEYEEEANPKLKKYGKKVVDLKEYRFLKISLFFLILFFVAFIFMVSQDKFKSEINIPECPMVNIPACPTCPVFPACPSCPSCPSFSCGNFPDNLSINLVGNSSG